MKTVMVLGAPRSGTSMTAGILDLLGVSMGRVRQPDALNPTGYFEDREFLSLADDILSAAMPGANGFRLPPPEAFELVRGRFDERIRDLTTRRTRECSGEIWGWKATALSLFADDCLRYISNPYVVIVLRNPASVASSITRYVRHDKKKQMYDELSLVEALQVVSQYETSIYGFIERHPEVPHIVLAYEEAVANPESAVRSLSSFLGIETTRQVRRRVTKFVSSRRLAGGRTWKNGRLRSLLQRLIRRFTPPRAIDATGRRSK